MRSGNLPSRYEVNTIPPASTTTKTLSSGDSTLYIADAPTHFPDSGTLRIRRATSGTAGVVEYVNYNGKVSFVQDVIATTSGNSQIEVASTTGLQPNGVQTITFDTPFANLAANKVYYIATVPSATQFTVTETAGSSTPIALTDVTGSAISPLSTARSGYFSNLTREQAGATGVDLTISSGASAGTVSSGTGIQKGQRVIGSGIPADTFVHSISGTSITLSKAVTSANPTGVAFITMGSGAAQTFAFDAVQPTGVELIQATSIPQISHWGSSVIMDGKFDDDRAYVYTVGSRTGREVNSGQTKALLAIRTAPSVDNGIPGAFGARELVNRMQLVLRTAEVSSNGAFFVELVLNPNITNSVTWENVGGTSLAQYADLTQGASIVTNELVGGEVIYGFYADAGVADYDLSLVKEISNSILGGGGSQLAATTPPNPTGVFPDGPEVLAVKVTNIGGGFGSNRRAIDFRISWTEAQA
tara:strand:- start:36 stop:1454 length:1419 start_codon:yes stop_codon:yes gene_type:complete